MLFRSNDTATTEIYTTEDTLSLHDALPIYQTIAVVLGILSSIFLGFVGIVWYPIKRMIKAWKASRESRSG